MGEEQSGPSAGDSAAPAAAKRHKTASAKARENVESCTSSKIDLMRNSDALLTLIGEIIHGDHECWCILLTTKHGKGPVQGRFAKHLTHYDHPLTLKKKEPSKETLSSDAI